MFMSARFVQWTHPDMINMGEFEDNSDFKTPDAKNKAQLSVICRTWTT